MRRANRKSGIPVGLCWRKSFGKNTAAAAYFDWYGYAAQDPCCKMLAEGIAAAAVARPFRRVAAYAGRRLLVQSGYFKAGVVISGFAQPCTSIMASSFDEFGYKLPDALEDEIEAMLEDIEVPAKLTGDAPRRWGDAEQRYISILTAQADVQLTERPSYWTGQRGFQQFSTACI